MRILLLSGGSGKRLWPLSNDARSKQFLKLLKSPDGKRESMVQRIVRQIKESGLDASITIATSVSQKDAITSQLGSHVDVVTEPERRDTFPAIALSTVYLLKEQHCDRNEVVVVMPIDPYTEESYFHTVGQMAQIAAQGRADLVLMGISPTQPFSTGQCGMAVFLPLSSDIWPILSIAIFIRRLLPSYDLVMSSYPKSVSTMRSWKKQHLWWFFLMVENGKIWVHGTV